MAGKTRVIEVLRRGVKKRCPRCGEGPLFRRWITAHERCPVCGLVYERDRGDTWMFLIITDRLPIFFGVVAVYFGFQSTNWTSALIFLLLLLVPMIGTLRERQGLAIALAYLSRVYLPDPSDDVHRPPSGGIED